MFSGTLEWRSGIVGRVTLAAMASTALGGLIAAAVAVAAVDWLIARHADRRLLGATATLAGELDEEVREQDGSLREVLADENQELVTSGIRLALYQHKTRIAGDAWVPYPGDQGCASLGRVGSRVRACARKHRAYVVVAAEDGEERVLSWFYLVAGLAAVCTGAGLGGAASVRLARWALTPLSDLTRKLEVQALDKAYPDQFRDVVGVAEVDAVRQALYETLSRLQDHLAALERFAADAAHELRTPLTLLKGELELLAEETGHDSQVGQRLSHAAARTTRLAELTESLLFLALPAKAIAFDAHAIALSESVSDVVDDLPPAQRQRLSVLSQSEGLVRGDATLLTALVRNAVDNALKYTDTPVVVRIMDSEKRVTLTVTDQGPGIRPELVERVFEPFFRVHPQRSPGHGLGLALVGHVARAHGGSAQFADTTRGTELVVSLPSWTAALEASERPPA